jgi:MoaA/NifB/PqqE/SkfB family radical SAM enzyme
LENGRPSSRTDAKVLHVSRREGDQGIDDVDLNFALNHEEWQQGALQLSSFPPYLRIDMETRCNIVPRCAYCSFDTAKERESRSNYQFTPSVFKHMGRFFSRAQTVLDCTFGEPLMSPQFIPAAELLHAHCKRFDFTTNGQLMNRRVQDALLGKNAIAHVSLEACTAGQYAVYRNGNFDVVIKNLDSLCLRKRPYGDQPHVMVAHLAMRSNVERFEEFVELMKQVGVDTIKVRTLGVQEAAEKQRSARGTKVFDYEAEMLDIEEFARFSEWARGCTENAGLQFLSDNDFGVFPDHPTQVPLCQEPWKTFYLMKRGIYPCCFGYRPLFLPDNEAELPLEQFLSNVWNSEEFLEIRSYLARGELAPYCWKSPSCLVLRRKVTKA